MSDFFITEKCVRCGACKGDCPVQAIENFFINQDKCIRCGDCHEICPVGAILRGDCHEENFFGGRNF